MDENILEWVNTLEQTEQLGENILRMLQIVKCFVTVKLGQN